MRKNTFKYLLISGFMLVSLFSKAQTVADEDTNPDLGCRDQYRNTTRTSSDVPNAVNKGTIDDRSCYSDYSESTFNGETWGVYNITDGSNHFGGTLQPRIERSLSRSQTTGTGSLVRFTGTFRILETADAPGTNNDGTYIAQAKGKHTGGGGSADPAICLYLAKPVFGTGSNSGKQVSFDIFAERILTRGGEGIGREIVFLKNVLKNAETNFELEVGFKWDPNDVSKKIHYCNTVIGRETFNWNIPEPERGTQSGLRYGAYRVKGGRAQIRWAKTTYRKVENIEDEVVVEPSDNVYRFRNVATGRFLTDSGVSTEPVTMTNSGEAENTHWTLVKTGDFVNIASETFGVLRAPGGNFTAGPYRIVSTSKAPPTADGDKIWTVNYNEEDKVYRFQSGTTGRYLYEEINGTITHIVAQENDDRSKWEGIPTTQTLSTQVNKQSLASVKIFPNPVVDDLTIQLQHLGTNVDIKIFNVLGHLVYSASTTKSILKLQNRFTNGLYLVKVTDNNLKKYYSKFIVK